MKVVVRKKGKTISPFEYHEEGNGLFEEGYYEEAMKKYEKAYNKIKSELEKDPNNIVLKDEKEKILKSICNMREEIIKNMKYY